VANNVKRKAEAGRARLDPAPERGLGQNLDQPDSRADAEIPLAINDDGSSISSSARPRQIFRPLDHRGMMPTLSDGVKGKDADRGLTILGKKILGRALKGRPRKSSRRFLFGWPKRARFCRVGSVSGLWAVGRKDVRS